MVNYACAFSQSESGKYFEWINNAYYNLEFFHRECIAFVNVFSTIFVCIVPLQTRGVDSPYYQVYISMENVYAVFKWTENRMNENIQMIEASKHKTSLADL